MTENHSEFTQESEVRNSGDVGQETVQQIDKASDNSKTNTYEVDLDKHDKEETCSKVSNTNCEEESSPLQDRWEKFNSFLKKFYRTILDGKKPPDEYECHVNIVRELFASDPHQLFARLEVDLQEFIIEIKLRQLELLDCVQTDEGPHLFIFCLIEGYNKLMFAAYTLSPLLLQLEVEHLARFNISWRGLNQHLFHTWVFTDPKIQKVLPLCISKLGKTNSEMSDFNKRLIRQFLTFDDEMTKVGGKWREAESAVIKYHQENSMLDAKWRMTKVNWDLIKNQTKIFHEELKSSGLPACIEADILNGSGSDNSEKENSFECIGDNGKKSPPLKNASLHIKTLTDSLKKMKVDLETLQDQQLCECCQTSSTQCLTSSECLDPESVLDMKSSKSCSHSSCNLGCKDSDILAHLNADGKKMYSHLHKFKVQQMSNGTKIQRSTSINISLKEMVKEHEPMDSDVFPEQPANAQQTSAPSSELHKTLMRKEMILQQRQQHQKKLMQMMQSSQQKDIQHKIQKQLQEHQLLLQQQRKIDELHAHLLQQHPINLDKEVQKSVHLQVQQRLMQKHKQVEEKFQQQVQQYMQQHQDKQSSASSASCNHSKHSMHTSKANHKCSGNSNCTSSRTSPVNVVTGSSVSTTSTTTSSTAKNSNVNSSPSTVTRKNSTTQTASATVNGESRVHQHPEKRGHQHPLPSDKRVHQHPLPDVVKSASYVCPKHNDDGDPSYSSENSSEDEFDWDRPNSPQRHCDCCYCEVFGTTPVSRNFQETRERLRLILTKKKAKSIATNNEKSNEQSASNGPTCVNSSQSASQGANKVKKENGKNDESNQTVEYKGDLSIEEILDFIEGNKNTNMKRTAKKMRRRQRQLEEEERRRKEEEAEKLRQEELRRKEQEEKRRLEEERRKQELLRKQGRKKGKQNKQQQSITKNSSSSNQASNKKNKNEKVSASDNVSGAQNKKTLQKQTLEKNTNQKLASQLQQQQKSGGASQGARKKDQVQESKQQQLNKQKSAKKPVSCGSNPQKKAAPAPNKSQKNDKTEADSGQPQMVTIKRVLQPNSSEPTVTITLRGATAKEDKVLYTLQNGQMCQVKEEELKKQTPAITITSINSGKKGMKSNVSTPNNVPYSYSNNVVNTPPPPPAPAPPPQQQPRMVTFTRPGGSMLNSGVNSITERMDKMKLGPQPVPTQAARKVVSAPPMAPQAELTTPAAIQINQAVNQLSSRPSFPNNFDLENIKLPPGITITKVDPATVQRKPIQQAKQQPAPVPQNQIRQSIMPPVIGPSNVIVVDTGDKNDEQVTGGKKKRRRRKKDGNESNENVQNIITNSYPPTNGLPPRLNPMGSGMYGNPFMNAGFGGTPQQQAAIIQMNGSMVTIRNPALHQALSGGEQQDAVTIKSANELRSPSMNGTVCSPPEEIENGDVDEYERELEAFKQFCSQSVPAESKPKVNLNIEDIVLKKKGPVIGCS